MTNILVVEDDADLANAIRHILLREGYEVDVVYDGEDGLYYAQSGIYDAIIFDVMLPKMNGFDAVETLRETDHHTPVLMLTAKGAIPDRIEGLDAGADSYMIKPFAPKELLARLRALLRRKTTPEFKEISAGDLTLDPSIHGLKCKDETVQLSNKEYLLAELFLNNAGNVLTRKQMADTAWDNAENVEDNSFEAYVSMLRKKFKFLNSCMRIENIRNIGYKLTNTQDGLDA